MTTNNGSGHEDKNLDDIDAELESIKVKYNDPLSECLFFQLSSNIAHVKKIAEKMERDLIELPDKIIKEVLDEINLKNKKNKERFDCYLLVILNLSFAGFFVYAARFLAENSICAILLFLIVISLNLYIFGRNR